jgi:hypothetical protein
MKLSISLLFAVVLSATTTVDGAESVADCYGSDGQLCGAQDSNCCGDYEVPPGGGGGGGGGGPAPENICPTGDDLPTSGESCGGNLSGVTCLAADSTYLKCTNGVFVATSGVGEAFTSTGAPSPTPCDGAQGCSGPAVIDGTAPITTVSKDAEEADVSDVDIGDVDSIELESAGTTAYSTIVSSIVGFTAVAGVVALL